MHDKNLLSSIKEVISRYDDDKDGLLSPKEAFCFLLGFWGAEHTPEHIQLVKRLFTDSKYEAQDVEEIQEGPFTSFRGNIPLHGMMNFCKDKLAESEEQRIWARNALISHGYEVDADEGILKLANRNPPSETYQTLCMRLVNRQLGEPDNLQLRYWLMEILNTMQTFHERPNRLLMERWVKINGYQNIETHWDNIEAQWDLDNKIAIVDYLEPSEITEPRSALRWNAKFTAVCQEIFSRYDADGDGMLKEDEMRLFYTVLEGRLPRAVRLNQLMQHPSLKYLMDEALEDTYSSQNLVRFALWHGYDVNLHLSADVSRTHLTINSLTSHLCQNIKLKDNKAVKFELEMLSDIVMYLLESNEPQLNDDTIQTITGALGLQDLPDIFSLKYGRIKPPINTEEALKLLILVFRYSFIMKKPMSIQQTFIDRAIAAITSYVELQPVSFMKFLCSHSTLEQLASVQSVSDYLDRKLNRVLGGKPQSIIPQILGGLIAEKNFGRLWKLMNPTVLVIFAFRLSRMMGYQTSNSQIIIDLMKQWGDEDIKSLLGRLVEQRIAAREFIDYLYCNLFTEPFPNVLPGEAEICQMTSDQISKALSEYLGISQEYLDEYFYRNGIIASEQLIGSVILVDAKKLQTLGVDRKTLATKFTAVLEIGYVKELEHQINLVRESSGPNVDAEWVKNVNRRLKQAKAGIQANLNVDVQRLPTDYPLKVIKCDTRGHHQDVFHPSNAMASYYLESDTVGGAADCLIVNTRLLSEEHQAEVSQWTYEDMEKLLEDRLNSPKKAEWEDWDGVLYCSDMNPYFIRVACCFEGEGTRYRVDVTKLCRILGFL